VTGINTLCKRAVYLFYSCNWQRATIWHSFYKKLEDDLKDKKDVQHVQNMYN